MHNFCLFSWQQQNTFLQLFHNTQLLVKETLHNKRIIIIIIISTLQYKKYSLSKPTNSKG